MGSIDGWERLHSHEQYPGFLNSRYSLGLGKTSLPCVYSPPLEVEVRNYWAELYIYHDTHLRSSELWSNVKIKLDSLIL